MMANVLVLVSYEQTVIYFDEKSIGTYTRLSL